MQAVILSTLYGSVIFFATSIFQCEMVKHARCSIYTVNKNCLIILLILFFCSLLQPNLMPSFLFQSVDYGCRSHVCWFTVILQRKQRLKFKRLVRKCTNLNGFVIQSNFECLFSWQLAMLIGHFISMVLDWLIVTWSPFQRYEKAFFNNVIIFSKLLFNKTLMFNK